MNLLENIFEVVRNLKHSRPRTKLCPRCKSPKLKLSSGYDIWLLPERYICMNCGYMGSLVLEVDKEEIKRILETNLEAANPSDASDFCNDS